MSGRRRALAATLAGLAVLAAVLGGWWWLQPQTIPLAIDYRGTSRLDALSLFGDGLAERVHVLALEPGARVEVALRAHRHGEIRLRVVRGPTRIDSRLAADVAALRGRPLTLSVGPGQRYVLKAGEP